MGSADFSLPLEGRVAAQRPGGVASAKRQHSYVTVFSEVPSSATPSAALGGTSPSRGEETP